MRPNSPSHGIVMRKCVVPFVRLTAKPAIAKRTSAFANITTNNQLKKDYETDCIIQCNEQ